MLFWMMNRRLLYAIKPGKYVKISVTDTGIGDGREDQGADL